MKKKSNLNKINQISDLIVTVVFAVVVAVVFTSPEHVQRRDEQLWHR